MQTVSNPLNNKWLKLHTDFYYLTIMIIIKDSIRSCHRTPLQIEKNRKKTNKNLHLVGKNILATYHSFRNKHSNFFLVEKIVKGIFLDATISL